MRFLILILMLTLCACEGPAGASITGPEGPPGAPAADVSTGGFTIEAAWLPLSDHLEQGVFSAPAIRPDAGAVVVYAAPPGLDLWYALPAAVPAPNMTLSYAWEVGALSLFLAHDAPGRHSARLIGWRIHYVITRTL